MKREILCELCGKELISKMKKVAEKLDEYFVSQFGIVANDCCCDVCCKKLYNGQAAYLTSLCRNKNEYYKWEHHYMEGK